MHESTKGGWEITRDKEGKKFGWGVCNVTTIIRSNQVENESCVGYETIDRRSASLVDGPVR